jgi:nicotinamidase-related amidase
VARAGGRREVVECHHHHGNGKTATTTTRSHTTDGVESHEVAAAARLRPEVVPAPSAVVGGFVVFTRDYTGANRGTDVRLFC